MYQKPLRQMLAIGEVTVQPSETIVANTFEFSLDPSISDVLINYKTYPRFTPTPY